MPGLTIEQIDAMLQKADLIAEAIEDDDENALSDALEIQCDFCAAYKKHPVNREDCCDNCPLWHVKACHHAHFVTSDFRTVDRYYGYFKQQSQDPKMKEAALESARRLHEVIIEYREKIWPTTQEKITCPP